MKITRVTKIDQIKRGDTILISDGTVLKTVRAMKVKVSEEDGVEVIFNLRQNKYFNVDMYLNGKSWVKDMRILSA